MVVVRVAVGLVLVCPWEDLPLVEVLLAGEDCSPGLARRHSVSIEVTALGLLPRVSSQIA